MRGASFFGAGVGVEAGAGDVGAGLVDAGDVGAGAVGAGDVGAGSVGAAPSGLGVSVLAGAAFGTAFAGVAFADVAFGADSGFFAAGFEPVVTGATRARGPSSGARNPDRSFGTGGSPRAARCANHRRPCRYAPRGGHGLPPRCGTRAARYRR